MSKKKVTDIEDLFPPPNWRKVLKKVKQMRKSIVSPVDTMGASCLSEKNIQKTDRELWKFQILVGVMLSSLTKDEMTAKAMSQLKDGLKKRYGGKGLCSANILKCPNDDLVEMISCVGFKNRKAVSLKKMAQLIQDNGDKVPETLPELLKIHGVGNKMALLALQIYGHVKGIPVDSHVCVIAQRLNWAKPQDNTPDKVRVTLEQWVPKENWEEINFLLVGFGQVICKTVKPVCENCKISKYCGYFNDENHWSRKKKKRRKTKKEKEKEKENKRKKKKEKDRKKKKKKEWKRKERKKKKKENRQKKTKKELESSSEEEIKKRKRKQKKKSKDPQQKSKKKRF
ncbi:endonuclease iii-like protein [Anaeramoeba flamelloides]|uniref:Endonuclease iii-like protein n=1 Tax=Anaeramoeba flamelloides TaxID=1746091 RepID=A0AAV7YC03_9EUKA|nr:endonuclease iii-like protein [Anaeramoeba flamelloides]